jgi:hypothetical protein
MSASRFLTALGVFAFLVFPASAFAGHENDPGTANMPKLGHNLEVPVSGGAIHSDIAFWRNYAFEGSYDGFRILDISNPMAPVEVSDVLCGASQGDMTISPDGNILIRSQDSGRVIPGNDLNQACHPGTSGSTVNGFEGLQIFNVSNKAAPVFVKALHTDFGSHTHTQYYDRANNRLIIYVSRSGTSGPTGGYGTPSTSPYGGQNWPAGQGCITAVEVPIANPANTSVVNRCIPAGLGGCHDVGVYEGIDRLYGACRPYMILWDISDPVNPVQLHAMTHPEVTPILTTGGWHSASFSWDGKILIAGWEPGGGVAPRCQATGADLTDTANPADRQTDAMKSVFFFRVSDGALLDTWVLPRPQTNQEACTIHNYNAVPHLTRHLLAMGNYTAGTSVLDFTDPMNARELGYVDPLPVDINKGGAWSSHWYNRFLWESDIDEGLNVFGFNAAFTSQTLRMPWLNPQSQGLDFGCRGVARSQRLRAGRSATITTRLLVDAGHAGHTIGQPAQRVRVLVRGVGVSKSARTGSDGRARFTVRPRRAGLLRVFAPGELNMEGCGTRFLVRPAPRGGTAGVGTGGGALTGRVTARMR